MSAHVIRLTTESSGGNSEFYIVVRRHDNEIPSPPHTDLPPDVIHALRDWLNGGVG